MQPCFQATTPACPYPQPTCGVPGIAAVGVQRKLCQWRRRCLAVARRRPRLQQHPPHAGRQGRAGLALEQEVGEEGGGQQVHCALCSSGRGGSRGGRGKGSGEGGQEGAGPDLESAIWRAVPWAGRLLTCIQYSHLSNSGSHHPPQPTTTAGPSNPHLGSPLPRAAERRGGAGAPPPAPAPPPRSPRCRWQ